MAIHRFRFNGGDGNEVRHPEPLILHGPLVQVRISPPAALERRLIVRGLPVPPPVTGLALVDTGATRCAVHEPAILSLGINPIERIQAGSAAGLRDANVYPGRITLLMPGGEMGVNHARLMGANLEGPIYPGLNLPLIALLGRDFLSDFTLLYDGRESSWTLFH